MNKISPFLLMYFLPKNLASFIFGKFAQLKLPKFLGRMIINWYVNHFKVNVSEAEFDLEKYNSLAEFFVRELKPGLRNIGPGIVSPVDGEIIEFGGINRGKLIQAKGWDYSIGDLVQDLTFANRLVDGYFLTLYLSPRDYHHIHSPVPGSITASICIPGQLWPVNPWSVNNIRNLFCRNERVVTVIEIEGKLAIVVMVGATNVGSISVSYDSWRSNKAPWSLISNQPKHFQYCPPKQISKGQKLGTFNLGSTVILLFEKGLFVPGAQCKRGIIKLGMSLTE